MTAKKIAIQEQFLELLAGVWQFGLIEPVDADADKEKTLPHLKFRSFLNKGELTIRKFKKTKLFKKIISQKLYVSCPLSYTRLHKNVGSLRENGGEDLRKATLQCATKILDRRYILVSILNYISINNKSIDISLIIKIMKKYGKYFFMENNDEEYIIMTELKIAWLVGIPFSVSKDNKLTPLTTINEKVLNEDAPEYIIELATKIRKEIEHDI